MTAFRRLGAGADAGAVVACWVALCAAAALSVPAPARADQVKVPAEKPAENKPAESKPAEKKTADKKQREPARRANPDGNVALAQPDDRKPDADGGAPSLIRHRPEIVGDLEQAERLIARGDFANGLAVLAELMKSEDDDALMPAWRSGGDRLFIRVHEEVQRRIGRLPAAVLASYRGEADPVAAPLRDRAKQQGDLAGLLQVVSKYRHTTAGPECLELAAAWSFDRADFAQAARLLEMWLAEFDDRRPGKAAAMVRLAVCRQLLGAPDRAAEVLTALRADPAAASAEIVVGGRRAPAATYLENLLRNPPAPAAPAADPGDWPAAFGGPSASRRMAGVEPALLPMWKAPPVPEAPDLSGLDPKSPRNQFLRNNMGLDLAGAEPERPMPAVVGDTVYLRTADALWAVNLSTGRPRWTVSGDDVRLDAFTVTPNSNNFWNTPLTVPGLERGRLGVTVADGRVFTVERFPAPPAPNQNNIGRRTRRETANRLTARDAATGRRIWSVGYPDADDDGEGEDEDDKTASDRFAESAIFLTAPTHSDGRLYVIADQAEAFHLVCLRAADGRILWTRQLSIRPGSIGQFNWSPAALLAATPPAVAGGTVYALTNAGVLAAVDELSGRLLWVFQYDDAEPAPEAPVRGRARRTVAMRPPNPVVVAGGRAVFLPADSARVFCVDASSGRAEWSAYRIDADGDTASPGLPWLAGIAPVRSADGRAAEAVVLAGSEVRALSLADGKPLSRVALSEPGAPPARAAGRPALTDSAVFLSVEGRGVARIDLADATVRYSNLPADADINPVMLGNLLMIRGRALAADPSGAALYADYATAAARLDPTDAAGLMRRGNLALGSGRPAEAEREFRAALKLAEGSPDKSVAGLAPGLRAKLLAADLALAEAESDPAARLARLADAAALAAGERDKAEIRLHTARTLAELGRAVEAVDAAQGLAEETPDTAVDPTTLAERAARGRGAEVLSDARTAAHAAVAEILKAAGRSAYARWDARTEAEFRDITGGPAGQRIVGLERLLRDRPHAAAADRVLFALAAEHAGAGTGARSGVLAAHLLARLAADHPASPLAPAARYAALMLTDPSDADRRRADAVIAELAKLPADARLPWPPDKPVAVRDAVAGLRSLRERFGVNTLADLPAELRRLHVLGGELSTGPWGGAGSVLLRGPDGRALVHDDCVFVLTPGGLCMAGLRTNRIRWRVDAVTPPSNPASRAIGDVFEAPAEGGPPRRSMVAVWDGRRVSCIDAVSGRLRWQSGEHAVSGNNAVACRDGVFAFPEKAPGSAAAEIRVIDAPGRRTWTPLLARPPAPDLAPVLTRAGLGFVWGDRKGVGLYDLTARRNAFGTSVAGGVNRLLAGRDGVLLAIVNAKAELGGTGLAAIDAAGRTIWTVRHPDARSRTQLLWYDTRRVVLAVDRPHLAKNPGELLVLDAAGGREVLRVPVAEAVAGAGGATGDAGPYAVVAVSSGDRLLVATGLTPGGPFLSARPAGTGVLAFDLSAAEPGKPAWLRTVADGKGGPAMLGPLTATAGQLAVFLRDQETSATRMFLLDSAKGTPLPAAGAEGLVLTPPPEKTDRRARTSAWSRGFPEVIAGALLVEGAAGVEVWSGP